MKVDYHMHTLCSDGIYEVETVVDMAVNNGILAMAVTDHDTLAGIGRARQRCQGRVRYMTGTELTCAERPWGSLPVPQSIHLLGYGFDENDETLCALLSSRKERTETVYRDLAEAVTASGCPLRIPDVPKSCGNVLQLRDVMAHVRKTFPSVSEETIRLIDSFSKNLTEANITVEDGIAAIHHAGGKAVWAHPSHSYHLFQKQTLQADEVSVMLNELVRMGLDGLETEYPAFSLPEKSFLNGLAADYQLFTTAGSDFHGSASRNRMGMETAQNSFFL